MGNCWNDSLAQLCASSARLKITNNGNIHFFHKQLDRETAIEK